MGKLREMAFIGAIMIVGVLAGTLYVRMVGGQPIISLNNGALKTPEERIALENKAIQIALSDPKISKLANVTGVKIFSTFYTYLRIIFDNNSTRDGSKGQNATATWDGKYRAVVTIMYPDGTTYHVDVNITDHIVEAPSSDTGFGVKGFEEHPPA